MMKSFIYSLTERTNTGNVTATVFRIKWNRLKLIGTTRWNTASYAGEMPEVVQFLMDNKQVTRRNHYSKPDTYHLEQV